jgi:hypothetical protein
VQRWTIFLGRQLTLFIGIPYFQVTLGLLCATVIGMPPGLTCIALRSTGLTIEAATRP